MKDEPVVRDRNWITSRKPDDLDAFGKAIVARLEGDQPGPSARYPSDKGAHA